jgi:hypothetical protein
MNDNIIKANMRINGLQRETISYSNFWGLVKDRATPVFIILAIIYILIEALQASGILPISVRAFVGVFEIGISIFFCYKYGYLGASLFCVGKHTN